MMNLTQTEIARAEAAPRVAKPRDARNVVAAHTFSEDTRLDRQAEVTRVREHVGEEYQAPRVIAGTAAEGLLLNV